MALAQSRGTSLSREDLPGPSNASIARATAKRFALAQTAAKCRGEIASISTAAEEHEVNESASGGPAYFEHDADVGIVGRGATPEAAFVDGARALFALVTRIEDVRPVTRVDVAFEEADVELAFVTWLNRLVAESQARGLALGRFALAREGARWRGEAWGEPWREELERGVDVKGATLTMLSVKPAPGGWEARCVVDV